jgi:hypothetical protein
MKLTNMANISLTVYRNSEVLYLFVACNKENLHSDVSTMMQVMLQY